MGTWNSRGLRGSTLEDMVNRTNERLREKNLALIQKIPTPITPVKIDKEHRHITLAYFEKQSTVDYIGAIQGIPVCFDAKECVADTFPLQNILRKRHGKRINTLLDIHHSSSFPDYASIISYKESFEERNAGKEQKTNACMSSGSLLS